MGAGGVGQGGFRTVWRCWRVDSGWVGDYFNVADSHIPEAVCRAAMRGTGGVRDCSGESVRDGREEKIYEDLWHS